MQTDFVMASRGRPRPIALRFRALLLAVLAVAAAACAPAATGTGAARGPVAGVAAGAPTPDPRVGLGAGLLDAEEAIWNLRKLSSTPPPSEFVGVTNSDLAFKDNYVFQGNYNGYQVWDISNPNQPSLVVGYVCPASQSDISVYENLVFVSGEGLSGRLDCGTEGVPTAASQERLRGLRIFDVSDIRNPVNVGNVQTCRGSHTHTVLVDPDDQENVYVYISGSAGVRPEEELPGCSDAPPEEDPNTALFRIEVIRVPLANPGAAEIVSSPRIFSGLVAPPTHGLAPEERAALEEAQARGEWVVEIEGSMRRLAPQLVEQMLQGVVEARGGTGEPTAADTTLLRERLPMMIQQMVEASGPGAGPTQCHDITVYPEIGLGGGACEGYGMLLDVRNPLDPQRIAAVADSNFSYWHSATFNNDGTKVLFTDEWGGGGQPKCRATDPKEWGANAIFTIAEDREMEFQSYFKIPAPQSVQENCVAHNGSLIPIPGRDIMVQAWYQGGISIFDWTDAENPFEIAFHDRGPVDPERMQMGGSWSVYWYNGSIVSSEIARGLDIFELVPSEYISQNEIDAANTVHLDYLNAQGQPRYVWPPSFALARAYLDQLERSGGLAAARLASVRQELAQAESTTGSARRTALTTLAGAVDAEASGSSDASRVRMLGDALRALAAEQ